MPRDVVGEEPLEQVGLGTEPNQLRDGVRCQGELRPDHGMIRKAAVALLQQPPQLRSNARQVFVCAARRTWAAYTRAIQEQWLVWLNPGESTRKDKGPKGRFRVNRSPLYPVVPGAVREEQNRRSRLRTGFLDTRRHQARRSRLCRNQDGTDADQVLPRRRLRRKHGVNPLGLRVVALVVYEVLADRRDRQLQLPDSPHLALLKRAEDRWCCCWYRVVLHLPILSVRADRGKRTGGGRSLWWGQHGRMPKRRIGRPAFEAVVDAGPTG